MQSASLLESSLGRQLLKNEREALSALSAEGLAKLNRDFLAGGDLRATFRELTLAHTLALHRRQYFESRLSAEACDLIDQLGRNSTLDELELLVTSPLDWVEHTLDELMETQNLEFSIALEDLAFQVKFARLKAHAKLLAISLAEKPSAADSILVGVAPLTPTTFHPPPTPPVDDAKNKLDHAPKIEEHASEIIDGELDQNPMSILSSSPLPSPYVISQNPVRGRLTVGWSPAMVWFQDDLSRPSSTYDCEDTTDLQCDTCRNVNDGGSVRRQSLFECESVENALSSCSIGSEDNEDPKARLLTPTKTQSHRHRRVTFAATSNEPSSQLDARAVLKKTWESWVCGWAKFLGGEIAWEFFSHSPMGPQSFFQWGSWGDGFGVGE